jgi:hypothetical protein
MPDITDNNHYFRIKTLLSHKDSVQEQFLHKSIMGITVLQTKVSKKQRFYRLLPDWFK